MNLEDVIDPEYGLQQDKWSLSRPTFWLDTKLEVIGWSGRNKSGGKFYILKCNECSKDIELFGHGVFKSTKGDLVNGQIPCGCSGNVRWTKNQWRIRASRKANEMGLNFIDFVGEWKGHNTKIKLTCPKHSEEWNSNTLDRLINRGSGYCPKCKSEISSTTNSKPDEEMIASFFASGAFHLDTKFWRSERMDKRGYTRYWNMYCPVCGTIGITASDKLQRGQRPCSCSVHRQQYAYINLVYDNEIPIAIKFGIANSPENRLKVQKYKSSCEIENHSVFIFPTKQQCIEAEKECINTIEHGVISKEQMPDGYTETTYLFNLEKIVDIYQKYGGMEVTS